MKWAFIFIWLTVGIEVFAQQKTTYVGTMGDTGKIEMEISTSNEKDYMGRYRYQGKKEWTLLKGAMYYDKRNRIAQNLVLYEFAQSQDTSVFDLYMEGKTLTGTWQKNKQSAILAVSLSIGEPDRSSSFDGMYRSVGKELSVKTISSNTVEINMLMEAKGNCEEIKLAGTLLKVGNEWKGSLPDQNDKGEVAIVLSFAGNVAQMEMIPAFVNHANCINEKTSLVQQIQKKRGD